MGKTLKRLVYKRLWEQRLPGSGGKTQNQRQTGHGQNFRNTILPTGGIGISVKKIRRIL